MIESLGRVDKCQEGFWRLIDEASSSFPEQRGNKSVCPTHCVPESAATVSVSVAPPLDLTLFNFISRICGGHVLTSALLGA